MSLGLLKISKIRQMHLKIFKFVNNIENLSEMNLWTLRTPQNVSTKLWFWGLVRGESGTSYAHFGSWVVFVLAKKYKNCLKICWKISKFVKNNQKFSEMNFWHLRMSHGQLYKNIWFLGLVRCEFWTFYASSCFRLAKKIRKCPKKFWSEFVKMFKSLRK